MRPSQVFQKRLKEERAAQKKADADAAVLDELRAAELEAAASDARDEAKRRAVLVERKADDAADTKKALSRATFLARLAASKRLDRRKLQQGAVRHAAAKRRLSATLQRSGRSAKKRSAVAATLRAGRSARVTAERKTAATAATRYSERIARILARNKVAAVAAVRRDGNANDRNAERRAGVRKAAATAERRRSAAAVKRTADTVEANRASAAKRRSAEATAQAHAQSAGNARSEHVVAEKHRGDRTGAAIARGVVEHASALAAAARAARAQEQKRSEARANALAAQRQAIHSANIASTAQADRLAAVRHELLGVQRHALKAAADSASRTADGRAQARASATKAERALADVRARRSVALRGAAVPGRGPTQSANRLSATLRWLGATSTSVCDEMGIVVWLRGVTVALSDDDVGDDFSSALALDDTNIDVLTSLWGANVVRIALDVGMLVTEEHFTQVDEIVTRLATAGAYTMLALRARDGSDTAPTWQKLAQRYAEEPALIFDIGATPVSPWTIVAPSGSLRPLTLFVIAAARPSELRSQLLAFEDGTRAPNVLYGLKVNVSDTLVLQAPDFDAFASTYPIFASEFVGAGDGNEAAWDSIGRELERRGIGFAAGLWNAEPRLVVDAARHDVRESRFGLVIRRLIGSPAPPVLTPFPFI